MVGAIYSELVDILKGHIAGLQQRGLKYGVLEEHTITTS